MKKSLSLIIFLVLCAVTLFAQAPEKFSYQAVVRNASNALVTNAPVGVRVSILQGSASGNAVYVETHTASTNVNGLLTLEIGGGTVQQGSFAGINWANGPFFLKTETDPAGGTNYTVTSTQQLMSVPYALYAEEAGNGFSGDYNDLTNKPNIPQNVGDLTNDAGYITQNDLPDIPTVPTNVSSFINDAGYVTLDSIPTQVNADWNATEGPAVILNKPVNAHFGHGIVRLKVNNAVGDTNIVVGFSNYTLMTGGVVSISFTNDVPAGATLDINEQGAKPIHYRGPALTDGVIKANDRCLFMYNASGNRYYLIANDRWGVDLDALATVAHTGSYNDLTDKPTIPEVPTNISAFVNDAGYITAIPDSFGGISLETDPIFSAWNKDYNDLINRPNLAPVATSGDYNDLSSKPVNADFGQGLVRTNVNNPAGATDINVTFTGYQLMNGGVVSLAFTRNVPAGATLNINGQGAKPIRWKGVALTDGVIKAGDRCLFMYNSGNNSYYLLANDRWGVDIDALATVAHTGSYNDLTDKPELFSGDYNDLTNTPTIPTEVSAFINDAGYITQDQIPAQVNADWNATNGPAEILNKPTIPTVPTNISAFVNDMGYITAIPDSLGGISLESDPIFTAWNKDYNDLTNRPELFSGDYNDLSNKPTNADFGHGIVRTNVNNAAGATDINVTFTGYQLMNGGVVSLAFTRNVPAGATLNINGQGAKAIRWKGIALTDGVIKAGDRCLFMYNSGNNSYYLLANDRWGSDIDALATVAFTGNYNDLTNTPELFSGDYNDLTNTPELFSGNYNDLTDKPTIPTIPENVSAFNNDAGYITEYTETDPVFTAWNKDYNDLINKPVNADFGHGIVRTNVNNASGATDINVTFTGYQAVNGGVVSLAFTRNVPAGATLNINGQGAKAIRWKGTALTDDIIKAGDRCLFMYNSGNNSYYLLAIDRWGVDIDALATVAHTGSYNDLTDKPNLAPVATSGSYNDLTNTPTIPTVPTNVGAFDNDAGYITADDIPAQVNADWNATEGAAQILNKPDLAPVATSGNYNDLTDKPTIPTVPTNVSAFVNDMGYLTSIPDSFGGISIESDPVFSNWDRDYNSLTNKPNLAPVATSGNYNDLTNKPNLATVATTGNYNDLTNKPTNADFGHGIVRTNVNNASGATDISTSFTGYQAVNGGIVSLVFTRNVPAGATLNINNQGAKAIRWKGVALTDGVIKAGDRCLFMYNSGNNSYYLLANDRWGDDLEALATVAHTGSYNDLVDKPTLAPVATSGNYNDLSGKPTLATVATSGNYNDLSNTPNLAPVATSGNYNDLSDRPTIPTVNDATLTIQQNGSTLGTFTANQSTNKTVNITTPTVNNATLTIQQNGTSVGTFTANQSTNQTVNIAAPTLEQVQALINAAVTTAVNDAVDAMQQQVDSLQEIVNLMHIYKVPSSGTRTVTLNTVNHVDVYDENGADEYGNNWDGSLTLVASNSDNVFKITGSYNTESLSWDTILIYNGTGAVGANTIVKLGGTGTISTPIYSSGNTITIRFKTDGSVVEAGFALSIDIVSKPSCTAAKAVDRQGNYYNTVQIGNQCWMKENLRTTKYADGSSISNGGSNISETTPYYYNYSSQSLPWETRGNLYNWAAVMRGAASSSANPSGVQGICPSGWHVPSDAEWTAMEATQTSMDVTADGWRGDHGGRLAGEGWNSSSVAGAPGNTNDPNHNASGFSAVPAGYCNGSSFYHAGNYAYFRSATQGSSGNAYTRTLNYGNAGVNRDYYAKHYGFSVRCLRD